MAMSRLVPLLELNLCWRQEHQALFRLDYLPPYSPDLNSIERLWKLTRATANAVFDPVVISNRKTEAAGLLNNDGVYVGFRRGVHPQALPTGEGIIWARRLQRAPAEPPHESQLAAEAQPTSSIARAIPWPPPIHMVTIPRASPSRRIE